MTVEQAREIIKENITSALELFKENGLIAKGKVYFSDKTLRECAEFNGDVILLFGAINFGLPEIDEEDFCAVGLCVETKLGKVDDAELEEEISDFKKTVQNMIDEVKAAPSPAEKICEINRRQDKEAEKSMQEFDLEMKKMKLKLYGALGILGVIAAIIIVVGFVL